MTETTRVVEKYTSLGWLEWEFKNLKNGDIFRMFDGPNRTKPVIGYDNRTTEFTVRGEPFLNDANVWSVEADLLIFEFNEENS
jgi:hypothetical protein